MNIRPFICLSVLFILSFSCNKESSLSGANAKGQLARILLAGNVESEFSYDDSGRLIKYTSYRAVNVVGSGVIRTYDDAGRLTKEASSLNVSSTMTGMQMDESYSDLSYTSANRLAETKIYRKVNGIYQFQSKSIPDYDSDGRIITVTLYDTNNVVFAKRTYAYNAQNNVRVEEFFQYSVSTQGPTSRSEYSYDDKKNPLEGKWVMPFGVNKNNITVIKGTSYLSQTGVYTPAGIGPGTTNTLYKSYTNNGYPAIVNENGVDRVYEYN